MDDKKRVIKGYEELYAIRFGGGELILAENPTAEERYMVCDCSQANPFGVDMYSNGFASADYLEIMKLFTERLSERAAALEAERETSGIPLQILTAADCDPKGMDANLEGRVIVIKPERLAPEYRSSSHQLALCTGGFGASPTARGRTVYGTNLFSGESSAWSRDSIAGTISADRLPEWAQEKLAALQQPTEKESVLEKIKLDRESKQTAKPTEPRKPKTKKHNKNESEL